MDYYQVSVSDWVICGKDIEIKLNKITSESIKRFPDGKYVIELENAIVDFDIFKELNNEDCSVKREYKVCSPNETGDNFCKQMEEKFFNPNIVYTKHQSSIEEFAKYTIYITNKVE